MEKFFEGIKFDDSRFKDSEIENLREKLDELQIKFEKEVSQVGWAVLS